MVNVRNQILGILEKYAGEKLQAEMKDISLIDDLGFDSLQLIEALDEIEKEFGISFEDGEKLLDMVEHLEEMIQYVESLSVRRW